MALPFSLSLALLLGACDQSPTPVEKDRAPKGVVFLLLDTVRADRMSLHGHTNETTPNLSRLAERGTMFERAQSTAPWTIPSVASMLTGVYPSRHRAGADIPPGEPRDIFALEGKPSIRAFAQNAETLFSRLSGEGYEIFGYVTNPLVAESPPFVAGIDVLKSGFDPANEVVDWAIETLDRLPEDRFALYLHFMDAHQPIRPPDEYLKLFLPQSASNLKDGEEFENYRHMVREWAGFGRLENIKSSRLAPYRTLKELAYDGALRFLDDQIGRLLQAMKERGLSDDVLFVVTSDHGEEFWDHWELTEASYDTKAMGRVGIGHGHTLFQELVHVPLFFTGPGVAQGRRVDARVPLKDMGVTILDVLGIEAPLGDGQSLTPYFDGEEVESRDCLSEGIAFGYELVSLVKADGNRLIWAPYGEQKDLLFDLGGDPAERIDRLAGNGEIADRLRGELKKAVRAMERNRFRKGERSQVSEDVLRDTGYVGGGESYPEDDLEHDEEERGDG